MRYNTQRIEAYIALSRFGDALAYINCVWSRNKSTGRMVLRVPA